MTRDTKESIVLTVFILAVAFILWMSIHYTYLIKKINSEEKQFHPTYIDTTKVQVLYEDTWGKILFIKEEDL